MYSFGDKKRTHIYASPLVIKKYATISSAVSSHDICTYKHRNQCLINITQARQKRRAPTPAFIYGDKLGTRHRTKTLCMVFFWGSDHTEGGMKLLLPIT